MSGKIDLPKAVEEAMLKGFDYTVIPKEKPPEPRVGRWVKNKDGSERFIHHRPYLPKRRSKYEPYVGKKQLAKASGSLQP